MMRSYITVINCYSLLLYWNYFKIKYVFQTSILVLQNIVLTHIKYRWIFKWLTRMLYGCIFIIYTGKYTNISRITTRPWQSKILILIKKNRIIIYYDWLRQLFLEYFIFFHFFNYLPNKTYISHKNQYCVIYYYTCTTAGKSDGYVPGGIEPLTDIFCLLSLSMAPSFCTSGVGILGLPLAFICPLILFEPKSKTHNYYDNVYTVQYRKVPTYIMYTYD